MIIDIINQHAEERLLELIEEGHKQSGSWGMLYFQASKLRFCPSEEDILVLVRPVLEDKHAALYFFQDGNIAMIWNGTLKSTLEQLRKCLYQHFSIHPADKLHHFYDLQAHGEDVRLLCRQKLRDLAKAFPSRAIAGLSPLTLPPLTPEQETTFQMANEARMHRKGLEILVVEDQPFSQKLLLGLLGRVCTAYAASNAEAGLMQYCSKAPDIVFLDIELPDVDGHQLAFMIHALDPQAYIVMVTANNHMEDVARAKANNAKGFIVKPYSKQKIMESIEKYITQHKLKD